MKKKAKTHKSTAKRFKITGSGKITRRIRSKRGQRFARTTNRKPKNVDLKNLQLSNKDARKVKNLLHK